MQIKRLSNQVCMIIDIIVDLCNLLYTSLDDMENLWNGVILAEEVVNFSLVTLKVLHDLCQ